jgi:hypothetical protein
MHVKSIHKDKYVPLGTGGGFPKRTVDHKNAGIPRPETAAKFSRSTKAPWLCLFCEYESPRFAYLRAHHDRMHKGKHAKPLPLTGNPKGWLNEMNGAAAPEALAVRSAEPARIHSDHPTAEEEASFVYCPKCAYPIALAQHAILQILKFSKR